VIEAPPSSISPAIHAAAEAIRSAEALLIGAGAGMGVDSGLPDFRGNEGFWNAYPPFKELGLSFIELANPAWFHDNPALAWGFYGHRRNLYRSTSPHAGFEILKKWAANTLAGSFVFTSNVDGHFQKAGFDEARIVECHGSLEYLQCLRFCDSQIWAAPQEEVEIDKSTFRARPPLPKCRRCGRLARPNVLMFGDCEWLEDRTAAQYDRYRKWRRETRGSRLIVLELGAGSAVPTVRHTCETAGGILVRINPREPVVPQGAISLPLGALPALTAIDACSSPSN
jgi:NAD-dependent SIR2 family protein deacetylase